METKKTWLQQQPKMPNWQEEEDLRASGSVQGKRAGQRASERGRRDGAVLSDTYLVPTYLAIRGLKPHLEVLTEIFQIGKDLRSQMTSQDDKFENIFNIYSYLPNC